jgi:hypothetical protein
MEGVGTLHVFLPLFFFSFTPCLDGRRRRESERREKMTGRY